MTQFGQWMAAAGLTVFPLLASVNLSVGQEVQVQPAQPRTTAGAQPGARQGAGGTITDRELVQWLVIDNLGEIQLSQFAQKQAESEAVQEFAQQMVKEHQEFIEKLQAHGGGAARPGAAPRQPREQGQEGAAARANPDRTEEVALQPRNGAQPGAARQPAAGRGGPVDVVTLKRELGQACLRSAMEMLQEKEGKEFDQAFMGMQLMLHQQMLDTLKVFGQHAQSQELQQVLAQGAETTEKHLDHAKEIMHQLSGKSGEVPRTATKRSPSERKE